MSDEILDYVVVKIKKEEDTNNIAELKICKYTTITNFGFEEKHSKLEIVKLIDGGLKFKTAILNETENKNQYLTLGADIHVVREDDGSDPFLRTDGNKILKDNLGELPTYE